MTDQLIRSLRLRAQRLSGDRAGSAAEVVRAVCGLQAQDMHAAPLGVRARSSGLTLADVDRARVVERSIVRTWCMRGTLHLVAAEDAGWLLALLGPLFATSSRRAEQLGLTDDTWRRGLTAVREILASRGPLTRAEIFEEMAARQGLQIGGQGRPHLLARAARDGLICYGPERQGEPAYVLLGDWIHIEPAVAREVALAELARRYLKAYAPAAPQDFAAWSGLPLADARAAWQSIAPGLLEVGGLWMPKERAGWLEQPPPALGVVRFLGAFDTFLLGYRQRDLLLDPTHAKRVNAGGGIVHPTILVDGRAEATWKTNRRRGKLEVIIEPFRELPADLLQAEVEDLGRFLQLPASIST